MWITILFFLYVYMFEISHNKIFLKGMHKTFLCTHYERWYNLYIAVQKH